MQPFSLAPDIIYLNHAAVAPWPQSTVDAVVRFAQENGTLGATNYPAWQQEELALKSLLARLINAADDSEIALLKNTSEALSIIAYGLPWKPGENIVSIAQEFPSNRIVWESLASQGVELRLVDLQHSSGEPEEAIAEAIDQNTRLLSVSSVQYASGLRLDLGRLGKTCRKAGILFCVDAIQSLGAIPFDVQACQADFVVADGHKWMLGPEGVALFYVRPEVRDHLRLQQFGWHMVEAMMDFDRHDWRPAPDARRFECGSPNMLGIHTLAASLRLLLKTGIEQVAIRIRHNMDFALQQVSEYGFESLTPAAANRRAGILSFRIPGHDNQQIQQALMQQQVICAYRGGGIRFSPHFYNTANEIGDAFNVIRQITKAIR
ncbi:aminotransferase class V-fold PLP-dependent enzyme [Candidatus Endoriftia persephone]|jgi:selenocysteine lyase/cysteine desulfurase|uniref:Cysteine desulfurase n=3 Tax=Gammaproteobacteria TaxID=1236 RepID=G2FFC0_9GAMM|nr:aminotransferase class V-fold PLP-dependent enzyme [Candidatus Endoriftia persephone]EGV50397.1 putative cysteine desulfurase [endosymbiont of Riftia pachyptila (vent Ph05)]EGW54498.1 cysteine desulfurase [endosymbiont of Tevnia jerichonana (vent Tica)]USF88982.1 aminotransferase class V-fold PLP-dependent enzyme [Candidatus Endoriftia persephone]